MTGGALSASSAGRSGAALTEALGAARAYVNDGLRRIPGWFAKDDAVLFMAIDQALKRAGVRGALLEIGVYQGASAILLGYIRQPGERFVVCDIFDQAASSEESGIEQRRWYADLTRAGFEANYRRWHRDLPEIVAAPSSTLDQPQYEKVFRFVHVDGSHVYEDVREDVRLAGGLVADGGVVVFDDYCNSMLPGVACAVWEAVGGGSLLPFAATEAKLYCTFGGTPVIDVAAAAAALDGRLGVSSTEYVIRGHRVVRYQLESPRPTGARRFVTEWVPPRLVPLARRLGRWAKPKRTCPPPTTTVSPPCPMPPW